MKKFTLFIFFSCLFFNSILKSQIAYMGIYYNSLHEQKAKTLQLNDPSGGLYIAAVIKNSPASNAGLQAFDYLYAVDGVEINTEKLSLGDILENYSPGDKAKLSFIRNGKEKKSKIILGNSEDFPSVHRSSSEDPNLGITQKHWKSKSGVGVKVSVHDNTTADRIGLKSNDVIVAIDDLTMVDWHDIGNAIDNREVGDDIQVTILRNGNKMKFNGPIGSHHRDLYVVENIEELNVRVEDMPAEEKAEIKKETGIDMPIVSDLQVNDLTVFPNPNVGLFNVRFNVKTSGDLEISIFNVQGKRIKYRQLQNFEGPFDERFDLGREPSGNYFLMLKQGEKVMTRKIVVVKRT
jgi:predicted metalloprotease with PDZ domain